MGIGASAGGLDAFKKFFAAMPADSGMAFVLIPHLDPTHRSLMVELLAKQTPMNVVEAEHDMPIEADCVYIIPPNRYLSIQQRRLQLSQPPERRGLQTAIDFFFRSLAEDQGENAIGIILSGTGSHGTLGLKEIKLFGGLVMVQDPQTADYDQMPRSAIRTGMVDFVLPPEQMPDALVKYVEHSYRNRVKEPPAAEELPEQLNRILAVLRSRTKYDFRYYRKNMLMRRVQRRMGLCQIDQFADYTEHLRENPDEVAALYKDLLIGVTGFFREPEAFLVLRQRVIPELVERQTGDVPVRVWVPGCATGEEAYSIGMLLLEGFLQEKKPAHIQLFATDIDEESLEVGRHGVFPENVVADVSPERLERFFMKTDEHHYQVSKQLRESVVFAPQNVISDAPFSKLDLVSCRNLLIYLEHEIQEKVISLFHFALSDDGFLLLGPSESIGGHTDLFEAISKKWRVYRRIGPTRRDLVDVPIVAAEERRLTVPHVEPTPRPPMGFAELTQKLLLAGYAPAAVLVNRRFEILYFFGPTSQYLELPTGEPTKDLMAMARQGLRTKVRAACHKALRNGETVTETDARVLREGSYVPCTITAKPISEPKEAQSLLLVTFEDRPEAEPGTPATAEADEESAVVRQLEYELKTTREDLQATIEELESSNEELKASNEEVMSMNEELQSTNEELETSKEELQSLNEELSTVNNQLQDKVAELEQANNDITNLLNSTDIATVFLDTELRIRRFTPATAKLLSLIASDVGRPFRDFAPRFTDDTLLDDCRRVLQVLSPIETELHTEDGKGYLRRILPYRTADNHIEGVVVTFTDITERKRREDEVRRLSTELEERVRQRTAELKSATDDLRWERDRIRHYLDIMGVTMVALDGTGTVTLINRAGCELLGLSEGEILGKDWFEHFLPERLREEVRQVFDRILNGECASVEHFENPIQRPDGEERLIQWHNSELKDDAGRIVGALASGTDITELKRNQDALRDSEARLSAIVDTAVDAIITIDERGIIDSVNPATERMFGYTQEELLGQNVKILMPPPYRDEHDGYIARYLETGEAKIIGIGREVEGRRKDGSVFPVDLAVSELHDDSGRRMFTGIVRDIPQRKAEHERLLQAERLALLGEAMAGLTHESRNALARSHANLRRLARRLKDNGKFLQLIDGAMQANEDIRRQFEEVREYAAPRHLQPEALQLPDVVRRAWDELAPERKGRDAELRIHGTDLDLTCSGDAHSLRNAFRNILENSLAACEDPVLLDIEFSESQIEDAPAVQVSIRDNGPGLPPEAAERAFDAFFTTKTKGTGLGLAIVKRTVEAHGGEVAIGEPSSRSRRPGGTHDGERSEHTRSRPTAGTYSGTEIIITLPRNPS